jgi:hypothetical protein
MSPREDDAIDALATTLDALEAHIEATDSTMQRATKYRLGLLHLHAGYAMYIAIWFATLDTPAMAGVAWTLIRAIPGSPITPAVLLFAGGMILAVATWRRALIGEIVGLCMLLAWYLTITVSFGGALLWWEMGLFPPGTPQPAPYAHGVYLHLSSLMTVHILVLIRLRRIRKAGR